MGETLIAAPRQIRTPEACFVDRRKLTIDTCKESVPSRGDGPGVNELD